MGKIIAIANQKGGVGKTTTAINLGGCLGVLEYKTLIVDADPQANATSGTGFDPKSVKNIYDCLVNNRPAQEAILETSNPNLFILPSHVDLVGAELEMINMPNREYLLRAALEQIKDDYDFILIDCSPSLGLMTVNALVAADSVMIPVQCEYFALEGVGKILNLVERIKQGGQNPNLSIMGIVLTMYDARTRLSQHVSDDLRSHLGTQVFQTIIPRSVRLAEAPSHGQTIYEYDTSGAAAASYRQLTTEFLSRL